MNGNITDRSSGVSSARATGIAMSAATCTIGGGMRMCVTAARPLVERRGHPRDRAIAPLRPTLPRTARCGIHDLASGAGELRAREHAHRERWPTTTGPVATPSPEARARARPSRVDRVPTRRGLHPGPAPFRELVAGVAHA